MSQNAGTSGLVPASAVLFDLDGTLVDTVGTRIAAWLQALDEFELRPDRDQVAALIGSDGRRLARTVASAAGKPIDDAKAEEIDRRSGEIYNELNVNPRPLPGVTTLLAWLDKRSLPWAIATSSRREQVQVSIDSLELSRQPAVIDGSHVKEAKPAPDVLLFAARELGMAPSTIWYVGDSEWDMRAADAAGMFPVGVATGAASTSKLKDTGARLTVNNLEELLPVLSRL